MKKSNVGRPSVVTPDVVRNLIIAFSKGYTDEEACISVDICKQALYEYCKRNPGFTDQKELLKQKPNMKAKENMIEFLEKKDKEATKRWLERRNKEEFSPRQEHTGAEGKDIVITLDTFIS